MDKLRKFVMKFGSNRVKITRVSVSRLVVRRVDSNLSVSVQNPFELHFLCERHFEAFLQCGDWRSGIDWAKTIARQQLRYYSMPFCWTWAISFEIVTWANAMDTPFSGHFLTQFLLELQKLRTLSWWSNVIVSKKDPHYTHYGTEVQSNQQIEMSYPGSMSELKIRMYDCTWIKDK